MSHCFSSEINAIQRCIAHTPDVLFAVLVGSRANESHTGQSDWDVAVLWRYGRGLERIGQHETLRHHLARQLGVPDMERSTVQQPTGHACAGGRGGATDLGQ